MRRLLVFLLPLIVRAIVVTESAPTSSEEAAINRPPNQKSKTPSNGPQMSNVAPSSRPRYQNIALRNNTKRIPAPR